MNEEKGICPVCGNEFKKIRRSHIYCSKKCANYASQKKFKEREKELGKEQIIRIRNSKKICAYCGQEYLGKRNSRYCSKACSRLMLFRKDMEKAKQTKADRSAKRFKSYNKNEQPCWTCKYACGGCRWSDKLKPVKGWDAVKVRRKDDSGKENMTGYKIKSCPKYEKG